MAQSWEWNPEAEAMNTGFKLDELLRTQRAENARTMMQTQGNLAREQMQQAGAMDRENAANQGALERMMWERQQQQQQADADRKRAGEALRAFMGQNAVPVPAVPAQLTQPVNPQEDEEAAAFIPRTQATPATTRPYTQEEAEGLASLPGGPQALIQKHLAATKPQTAELGQNQALFERDPATGVWTQVAQGAAASDEGYTQEEAQARADLMNKRNPNAFTGIASDSKGRWRVVQHPPTASLQGEQLTPSALDAAAQYYNQTGALPPGMSRNVQSQRQIMNRAAQLRGGMPGDLAVKSAGYKADAAALAQLQKQEAIVNAFEATATKNAAVAEKLSDRVDRSGTPVYNRWLIAGRKSVGGDPDVASFHASVETFTNEYAKIMSSATGSGVTSDQARQHAREMLNEAMTPAQFHATVAIMKQDMANRRTSYREEAAEIRSRIGIPEPPQMSPQQQARDRLMNKFDRRRQ